MISSILRINNHLKFKKFWWTGGKLNADNTFHFPEKYIKKIELYKRELQLAVSWIHYSRAGCEQIQNFIHNFVFYSQRYFVAKRLIIYLILEKAMRMENEDF